MEKVIRRYESFQAAHEADVAYYRSLTSTERMNILLELVNQDHKNHETECRLERVYRIVELAQS